MRGRPVAGQRKITRGLGWCCSKTSNSLQFSLYIPGVVGYKCWFYCQKGSSTTVKIVAVMFPDLTVYCDKVHQEYDSTMKSIRFQKFSSVEK